MLIYLDNGFFRKIVSDKTNMAWDQFYDECRDNEPDLVKNGYDEQCSESDLQFCNLSGGQAGQA